MLLKHHNRSRKAHARLMHALYHITFPREQEIGRNWNAKHRRGIRIDANLARLRTMQPRGPISEDWPQGNEV